LFDKTIVLTGKFDKFECLDEKCHQVRVVDYKTGKPKSRNEIEGKTKSAQATAGAGAYKRQLVFYKLLLSMYADGMYNMKEGVLDFIEPTESGMYKKEVFIIEKDELLALEEDIRRIANEIQTLSFWNIRCGDPKCDSCALRDLMESRLD
jgi:hypothetical protein